MRKVLLAGLIVIVVTVISRSRAHQSGPGAAPGSGLIESAPISPKLAETLRRSCFDCHSDETRWPWYSNLPIASWLIERDVSAGRAQLNFSRWAESSPFDQASLLDKACTQISAATMPPKPYLMMHSDARLDPTDVKLLCRWTRDEINRLIGGPSHK